MVKWKKIKELDRKMWLCRCVCGHTKPVNKFSIMSGRSKGCRSCSRKKDRAHHKTKMPEYAIWQSMKQRCKNKKSQDYYLYGARGIDVCTRWESFENFISDMGKRPKKMTLDRIDNNKGYSPENCRWVSQKIQSINKRTTKRYKYNGRTLTICELSKLTSNISKNGLRQRIKKGMSVRDALKTPNRYKQNGKKNM